MITSFHFTVQSDGKAMVSLRPDGELVYAIGLSDAEKIQWLEYALQASHGFTPKLPETQVAEDPLGHFDQSISMPV